MKTISIGEAIDRLIEEIDDHDPTHSIPIYNLENLQPKKAAQYCVVDSIWLHQLWYAHHPDELIPHTHIGD